MHTYSVETLIHFSCGQCRKWWSIASLPVTQVAVNEWSCPECGSRRGAVEAEDWEGEHERT